MTDILRFEAGRRYGVSLMNEDDGRCEVTIIARTSQTVTTDAGKTHRVRIWGARGDDQTMREVISPLGRYSMAPVVTAADLVEERNQQ